MSAFRALHQGFPSVADFADVIPWTVVTTDLRQIQLQAVERVGSSGDSGSS